MAECEQDAIYGVAVHGIQESILFCQSLGGIAEEHRVIGFFECGFAADGHLREEGVGDVGYR